MNSTLSIERSSEQTVADELGGGPVAVTTSTTPTVPTTSVTPTLDASSAPDRDIEQLIVRFAGPGDEGSLADLEHRAESARPTGGLVVAEVDGRLLTAVALSSGQALSERTPSGAAAEAVVRYTLATWERQGRTPRRRLAASVN